MYRTHTQIWIKHDNTTPYAISGIVSSVARNVWIFVKGGPVTLMRTYIKRVRGYTSKGSAFMVQRTTAVAENVLYMCATMAGPEWGATWSKSKHERNGLHVHVMSALDECLCAASDY